MKDHSDAAMGDNAGKKFKEYNDVLSEIENSLQSAARLQKKSNEATYAALGKALELGQIFAGFKDDFAALKEYLQYKEQPFFNTKSSPGQPKATAISFMGSSQSRSTSSTRRPINPSLPHRSFPNIE